MANTTIDVLFRFKQVGDDVVNKLKQGLKEAEASFKTSSNHANFIDPAEIKQSVSVATGTIVEALARIESRIDRLIDHVRESFSSGGDGMLTTLDRMSDTGKEIIEGAAGKVSLNPGKIEKDLILPVEGKVVNATTRVVMAMTALIGSAFAYENYRDHLETIRNKMLDEVDLIVRASIAAGKGATTRFLRVDEFKLHVRALSSFSQSVINKVTQSIGTNFSVLKNTVLQTINPVRAFITGGDMTTLYGALKSMTTLIGTITIFRYMKEGYTVLKQAIVGSWDLLNPLQHASRAVAGISSGMFHLFSSLKASTNLFKTAILGSLYVATGGIGTLFSFIGMGFKSLVYMSGPLIQSWAGKYFGSTKARIVEGIAFVRDSLFKLASSFGPILDRYVKNIVAIESSSKKIFKDLSKGKGDFKTLSGSAEILKGSKMPITIQLQTFKHEFMALMRIVTGQILYIAGLIEKHVTGQKINLNELKTKSFNTVAGIASETKKATENIFSYGKGTWSKVWGFMNKDMGSFTAIFSKTVLFPIMFASKAIEKTISGLWFVFSSGASLAAKGVISSFSALKSFFSGLFGFFGKIWGGITGLFKKAPVVEKSKVSVARPTETVNREQEQAKSIDLVASKMKGLEEVSKRILETKKNILAIEEKLKSVSVPSEKEKAENDLINARNSLLHDEYVKLDHGKTIQADILNLEKEGVTQKQISMAAYEKIYGASKSVGKSEVETEQKVTQEEQKQTVEMQKQDALQKAMVGSGSSISVGGSSLKKPTVPFTMPSAQPLDIKKPTVPNQEEIKGYLKSFFQEFSKMEDRVHGLPLKISAMFNSIKYPESSQRAINDFLEGIILKLAATGEGLKAVNIGADKATKIFAATTVKTKKDSFDPKILEALEKEVKDVDRKDFGGKIIAILTGSVKVSQDKLEKVIALVAELIASYFPQSPAKKGALKGLANSGQKIVEQVGQGITKGKSKISSVIGSLTEHIMKFFPRSPAQLGALTALTSSGFKIPLMLSQGIDSGMLKVTTIIDKMAEMIMTHLKPAIEMGHAAERIGVNPKTLSLLEYSLSDINVTASDLQYTFQSLNKLVSDTVTPEQLATFKQLNIDLVSVSQAAEPTKELFLQIAESVSKLPADSKLARQALEAIGASSGTNLTLAFRKSREEIERLMDEGSQAGTFWDEAFIKASKHLNSIWERIKKIRDYIFKEFLSQLLPVFEELSDYLFDFVKTKNDEIRDVTGRIGRSIRLLYNIVKETIKLFLSDAGKGSDVILVLLNGIWNFIGVMFGNVWDTYSGKIFSLLKEILKGIKNALFAWITYFWQAFGINFMKGFSDYVLIPFLRANQKMLDFLSGMGILKKILPGMKDYKTPLEGLVDGLQKGLGTLNTKKVEELEYAFSGTLDDVVHDTKKAAEKISESGGKLFNLKTLKKFMAEAKDEYLIVITELTKATKDTELQKYFKELGEVFTEAKNKASEGIDLNPANDRKVQSFRKNFKIENVWKDLESIDFGSILDEGVKEADRFIDRLWKIGDVATKNAEKIKQKLFDEKIFGFELTQVIQDINERAYKSTEARYIKELAALDKKHMEEIAKLEQMGVKGKELEDIRAAHAQERADLEANQKIEAANKVMQYIQTNAQTVSSMMDTLYELSGEKVKEFFYIAKATAIAESVMNTAQGVTKALAEGGVWGIAQGAIVAAAGTVQVAKIMAETLGYKTGGKIPGSGSGDIVPIRAEPGEFMNSKPSVDYYGPGIFEALNRKLIPKEMFESLSRNSYNPVAQVPKTAFQTGGYVQRDSGKGNNQSANINIINVDDPYKFERSLNTSRGAKMMLNFMNNNKREITKNLA